MKRKLLFIRLLLSVGALSPFCLFTSETIHESFINIEREGWRWTQKKQLLYATCVLSYKIVRGRRIGVLCFIVVDSDAGVERAERKKLYNYVSVYDSHFPLRDYKYVPLCFSPHQNNFPCHRTSPLKGSILVLLKTGSEENYQVECVWTRFPPSATV